MNVHPFRVRKTVNGSKGCLALVWRSVVNSILALAIIGIVAAQHVLACGAPPPIQCSRSTTLSKVFPRVILIGPGGAFVALPTTVFISATAGATPPCANPTFTTVTLTAACVGGPSPAPGSVTFGTPAPGFYGAAVPLFFPPGPPRICVISGSASTSWTDGRVTVGTGDVTVCLVEASPSDPSVPRLDMELLSPPQQFAHPGDGRTHVVRLTNNDPTNSVTGLFEASSNQTGRLSMMSPPPIPGMGDGPGSTATPFTGDAFPMDFEDPLMTPCVPLPDPDMFSTFTITRPITLAPGETRVVRVRQRSWPMCRSGSCSETLLKFQGTWTDTTAALACCQGGLAVDSTVPPDFNWPDNGMMMRALPAGPAVVFQGFVPTHSFLGATSYESTPFSGPNIFNFFGPSSHVMDVGFGDNMGRTTHNYQIGPPLNLGQPVQIDMNVHIDSQSPGIDANLQGVMVKPGDPALGDTYFHLMTRSRLTGPGVPPTLDSFFDVFYAVSLDGISGGMHRAGRILPGTITATPTGPTTMNVRFTAVFEPLAPLPPSVERMEIHVDPIANLIGVAPPNDSCGGAFPLTEGVQFMGDSTNAIGTTDGPPGTCATGLVHAVWHTFSPATSGVFDIDTCGTNFDTVLVAFTGADCNTLSQAGCDDDSTSGTQPACTPNGLASRIESLPMTAGQMYWIRMGGFSGTNYGPYKVLITRQTPLGPCCIGRCCTVTNQANCFGTWLGPGGTCNPNPCAGVPNDECATALPAVLGANPGGNCDATTSFVITPSTQCGTASGAGGGRDVWHAFTPSQSAEYTFDTCAVGTLADTTLAIYAACPADGTVPPLACNDDASCSVSGLRSRISNQTLVAGQTYLVRVASYAGAGQGTYVLNITQGVAAGACCSGTGCTITTAANCSLTGYQGDFTTCNPNPCLPPTGACCCGSTCSQQTAATCLGPNTQFLGAGVPCNAPGNNAAPCCYADYNQSGAISVQDIFDFLAAYFGGDPCTDINSSGPPPSVQDIFDFLAAYFAGC